MSKKKKILLSIAIVFFGILISYQFVGSKGYLKVYKIPTTASSPTLEPGDYILVSNLVPTKNNDYVVFKRFDENFGMGNYVFRMIAKEGDTLSIINGATFVNNVNTDKDIRTKHAYKMHKDVLNKQRFLQENNDYYQISNDSIFIFLEDQIAKSISKKVIKADAISPKKVHETFPEEWNSYTFGPLIIPENTFFVMGDNRDNAMDSRFIGLIDQNNYVGKAINVN
ncbi:MAG: signal peptidase I [Dokdonia sp.]|jgi:signal peptidase I